MILTRGYGCFTGLAAGDNIVSANWNKGSVPKLDMAILKPIPIVPRLPRSIT